MKPNEEEKQHSMFDPLFNDTHSYAEDEKEYFTIESKEKKELLDVEDNIYENAGIFSTIFFKWVSPVISIIQQKRMSLIIFGKINQTCRSEIQKELVYNNWKYYTSRSNNPIMRSLISTYSKELWIILFYSFVKCIIIILQPILVILILEYIQNPIQSDRGIYYGLGLVIFYNVIDIISNLIGEQSDFIQAIVGINAKHGIIGIIYDKILKISQSTNKRFSQSEIINFINVDVEKVTNISSYLSYAACLPFQALFGFCFLFYYFEFLMFSSIAIGIIFTLLCFCIGLIRGLLQKKICIEKDKRMSATNEIINSIKAIKFNSLSDVFIRKILKLRNNELFLTKLSLIIEIILLFFTLVLSAYMVGTVLVLYNIAGFNISIPKAYATLIVIKMLEIPLKWVPLLVNSIVEFTVSMKRIHKFLISKEMNPLIVSIEESKFLNKVDIMVENANFTWGEQKKIINEEDNIKELEGSEPLTVRKSILLKSLNLTIYTGEFICIIGEVGSGKSSLISALLGDMIYVDDETLNELGDNLMDEKTHDALCDRCMLAKGVVRLGGSVCLVQQNPWIQNKTIRDNILFGLPLHKERYNRTIEACQLAEDLEILKGGDLTEIGEKGINLSGGQKARISLARAVYSCCDIVLMDDPVSALDSNVKHKVFEEVFCGELKHKTRILVTHAVEFLHLTDRIVIVEHGGIKHIGTYKELENSSEIKHAIEMIAKTYIEDKNSSSDNKELNSKRINNYMSNEATQLIENENNEFIESGCGTYRNLFIKDWNWIVYILLIPVVFIYIYFGAIIAYSYGIWIKNFQDNSVFWRNFASIMLIYAIFVLAGSVISAVVYLSTIRKSRILHENMIKRIVNAPINYFERTPSGNILNRFSRDLSKLDCDIYRYIAWFIECMASAVYIFCVAIMNSMWVLVVLPFMILFASLIINYYLKAFRELVRIQSVDGSLLTNHLNETLSGLSTIRAFKKQDEFCEKNNEYLNKRIRITFWREATKKWFSTRINLISSMALCFTSIFCVS